RGRFVGVRPDPHAVDDLTAAAYDLGPRLEPVLPQAIPQGQRELTVVETADLDRVGALRAGVVRDRGDDAVPRRHHDGVRPGDRLRRHGQPAPRAGEGIGKGEI